MSKYIIGLLFLGSLGLAACGTPATLPVTTTSNGVTTTTPGTQGTGLVGYTTDDLLSTKALATANNDVLAATCADTLYGIVASYTPPIGNGPLVVDPTLPAGAVKGLAYKAEYARIIARKALDAADSVKAGVITPAMRMAFAKGCGPLVLDFQMDQVRTVADLTGLMTKLAAIP